MKFNKYGNIDKNFKDAHAGEVGVRIDKKLNISFQADDYDKTPYVTKETFDKIVTWVNKQFKEVTK